MAKLKPGDRVGMTGGDNRAIGKRQDGSWCYEMLTSNPNDCGGGRRHELALCFSCRTPLLGKLCPYCGTM
jgi:hypothetical protein